MFNGQGDVSVSLSREALHDLSNLVEHADRLAAISTYARDLGPVHSLSAASGLIAERIALPADTVSQVVRALVNLRLLKDRLNIHSDLAFQVVSGSLEISAPSAWKERYFNRWRKAREKVVAALDEFDGDHPLAISIKAERLTYAHQNVVVDSGIITDIRPIFNKAGDKIVESIVTHSLVLTYSTEEGTARLHFSMDARDVQELRRQCERAERKAATIRAELRSVSWPTKVIRDDGDE